MTDKKEQKFSRLQHSFDSSTEAQKGPETYKHDRETEILSDVQSVLGQSPTGRHLLQVAREQRIVTRVLKGREVSVFVPEARIVYLTVPTQRVPSAARLALHLGGALREAEQILAGHQRPDEKMDPLDFAAINFAKQLDITMNMCKIAQELSEGAGLSESLDELEDLGHGELYKAYRSQKSENDLVDLFLGEGE